MDRQGKDPIMPDGWREVSSSGALFRKFEFEAYDGTREFLDKLAELSERSGIYPDLSFASKHVNVTVHAPEAEEDKAEQYQFAADASALTGD